MQSVQQRLPSLIGDPIAFAHRGAKAHAPENTLEAFALALRLGANGLETDMWRTADGHIVLDHDGIVKRWGRSRPISEVPLSALPSHIPTLEKFYEEIGTDFHFSVDVKDEQAYESIVRISSESTFDLSRLWLCHHKVDVTVSNRAIYPDVRFVDSTRLSRMKEGPERRCALLLEHGVDALNMHHSDWNGGLVTLAHKFELFAFSWDMQFEHVMTNHFRMGVDAVYSDYVDRLVDVYSSEVGHVPTKSQPR